MSNTEVLSKIWDTAKAKQKNFPKPKETVFIPDLEREIGYHEFSGYVWETMVRQLRAEKKDDSVMPEYNDHQKEIIKGVLNCAMSFDMFGQQNPARGIYLFGEHSTGKTFVMKTISQCIQNLSVSNVNNAFRLSIWDYKSMMLRARKEKSVGFIDDMKGNIYLDDFGYLDKSEIKIYGQDENTVQLIVEQLHRQYSAGYKIFITSNMSPHHLASNYGRGTFDRLFQMCNIIGWDAKTKG